MTAAPSQPRVWLVDAYRAGEHSQILALAEALGWPFEIKTLRYRAMAIRTNLFRGSDLKGIDRSASSPLEAPWPDLVISAGMRNEPVCRWIRQRSGGRCKIVHVGRPWADPSRFDLVITTPQYRLPVRDNVLHNSLTLNRVNSQQLQAARVRWASLLGELPQPRIAVICGGDSGPYTLGAKSGKRLAKLASEMAGQLGGSLMVTTSARTRPVVADELEAIEDVPSYFYRWQPGDSNNPYFGYLALADHIIVTADSISMLSEACATGKPVHMFDLGIGPYQMRAGNSGSLAEEDFRLSAWGYRALMRWGWQRLSRDITLVHRQLEESGRAVWLGEPPTAARHDGESDLDRAVARVRALFDE